MRDSTLRRLRRMPLISELWNAFERMQAQLDQALAERAAARNAEQAMRAERDAARKAEQARQAERDTAVAHRDAARSAELAMQAQRAAALADRIAALADRDAAHRAERAMRAERDAALAERDAAREAEQALQTQCDAALAERDAAREAEQALRAQRDAILLELESLRPGGEEHTSVEIGDRFRLSPACATEGRNAVIVPVHGAIANREINITQPFFASYCRDIGADLRIVDVPESVPDLLVKANLLPIARDYRRFAIVASDVLIREGCPDLFSRVPEDRLGMVAEGQWTDCSSVCAELADMYGFATPLPTSRYVDSGVMVMSGMHLPLLETLLHSPVIAHPRNEQGFINACLYRNDIRPYELPREFNWIPYTPEEFDWRWAWIFQMADCWRSLPKQQTAWQRRTDRRSPRDVPVPLAPRHCRLACLTEIAGQLRGETIRVVHPGDMDYHPPAGRVMVTADDAAVMWCEPGARTEFAGLRDSPPIYGPYAALEAGRWSVSLLGADGQMSADGSIVVDMAYDIGSVTVRRPAPVGSSASFEILLERDVADAEVRLYRGDREFAVGAIVFRRLADG